MKLSAAEQQNLAPHLHRTVEAIEEILQSGLTTANKATYQTFAVTFQEASRLKLLRLGATLRSTHEEISRYVNDNPRFSSSRLMFFLNRSWLLCKGIEAAISAGDGRRLADLLLTPTAEKVDSLEVVCLGVVKKVAEGTFCAFDFRLRSLEDGEVMTWSTVFPMKEGVDIPAEGYLHLPQKQKFTAHSLLEGRIIHIDKATVTKRPGSATRIQLADDAQVRTGKLFDEWERFFSWDAPAAIDRIRQHVVTPFDTEIDLQEEVVFSKYELQPLRQDSMSDRAVYPLSYLGTEFDLIVSAGTEGEAASVVLNQQQKKKSAPPLFGLVHYSGCRFVVQPLSLFRKTGPEYITISKQSVDRKTLLSAIRFT